MIPQQDTLWVGLVNAAEVYEQYTNPWTDNKYGVDMSAAQRIVTNSWEAPDDIQAENLLCPPQRCATLDYTTINSPNVDATVLWSLEIPPLARFNIPRDSSNWCADAAWRATRVDPATTLRAE